MNLTISLFELKLKKLRFVEHDVCIGKVCACIYVYVWMSVCTVYDL